MLELGRVWEEEEVVVEEEEEGKGRVKERALGEI